jgi:hypothetical protein
MAHKFAAYWRRFQPLFGRLCRFVFDFVFFVHFIYSKILLVLNNCSKFSCSPLEKFRNAGILAFFARFLSYGLSSDISF